jgi:hypothetical protein
MRKLRPYLHRRSNAKIVMARAENFRTWPVRFFTPHNTLATATAFMRGQFKTEPRRQVVLIATRAITT